MYSGTTSFSKRTERVLRAAGLVIPSLLVVYGLAIRDGLVDDTHYAGDTVFVILMGLWMIVSVKQFIYPPKNNRVELIQLSLYHIFAGLFIALVAGFATSFVAAWVILMFTTYSYFRKAGLILSTATLVAVGVLDVALNATDIQFVISDLLSIVATITVGLAVVAISRTQEVDNADLMQTKALETLQRDRILTLVNNLADAVLSTDKNGVIRVYNAASLNLLDTNNSLNGNHVDDVIVLHDQKGKVVKLSRILKNLRGVQIRDDLTFKTSDETLRIELTCSPIHGSFGQTKKAEQQDGYILILRDVTKAKSLEEERDEFISVVSHELRTPITIVEGTISNVQLMMDRKNFPASTLKQAIGTAHEQVIFLSKMVNDLSTLSRAERGVADTPETIDVRSLVDEFYNEYAPQAAKKNLHFNLDLTPRLGQVTASRLYLKELLQNFITNSLKYTKEGTVTFRVSRKNNKVTFEVSDTGIGISKSDQEKIFNKFYRSEDYRTRETGGTGLGLYVAMKLAKKLGTKILMTSRLNHGSSFSIKLPVEEDK
jgi:signal transduction histidine kinase